MKDKELGGGASGEVPQMGGESAEMMADHGTREKLRYRKTCGC